MVIATQAEGDHMGAGKTAVEMSHKGQLRDFRASEGRGAQHAESK
jgi:hypothetical protein